MNSSRPVGFGRRSLLKSAASGLIVASAAGVAVPAAAPAATQADNASGKVREYWVQADNIEWNVVPNGRDNMMGVTYKPSDTTYLAVGYRAYTPGWQAPLPSSDDIGLNNGVPGPIFRGNVGDTILVHFRNNDQHYNSAHSLHAHGLSYAPDSDGTWMADDPEKPGTAVLPGQSYTYTWTCAPSSLGTWMYHDHSKEMSGLPQPSGVSPIMEVAALMGMYGFIVVTDRSEQRPDREFFLFMSEFWPSYIPLKIELMGFNGYAFVDNTPTLTAKVGERVRWHVAALGLLPHVFHIHGHRWSDGKRYVDAQSVEASETLVLDWVEDNPGSWLYHCHYPEHFVMGMAGRYVVTT